MTPGPSSSNANERGGVSLCRHYLRLSYWPICIKRHKSLKKISSAHNADDFSVLDDRSTFDPMLIE
jgi:hypothetical protein